jgi:hypothetical protein
VSCARLVAREAARKRARAELEEAVRRSDFPRLAGFREGDAFEGVPRDPARMSGMLIPRWRALRALISRIRARDQRDRPKISLIALGRRVKSRLVVVIPLFWEQSRSNGRADVKARVRKPRSGYRNGSSQRAEIP